MLRITFAAVLLFASSLAGAPFAPANPVTHVRYGASGVSARASVASNGRGFVAVWQTDRDQRVARIGSGESNVGVPIEHWGFSAPAIAAFDDRYVIAANDGQSLEAIFVDDVARPIGTPIPIMTWAVAPTVAAYGDRAVIMYAYGTSTGFLLEGALLSRNGGVLKKTVVLAANLVYGSTAPWTYEIAASASGFAVTTASQRTGVSVTTLDRDGNVRATTLLEQPRPSDQPAPRAAIASDGSTYVALWTARDGTLRGANLDAAGVVLRTATIATTMQRSPETQIVQTAVAFDGRQYICGYVDGYASTYSRRNGDAYVTRFDSSLHTLSAPSAVQADNHVFGIAAAAANGSSLVVWADRQSAWMLDTKLDSSGDLHAALVTADGIAGSFPIATAAAEQLTPAAASNGIDTLIAWNERTAGASTTMAGILDGAGRWKELGPVAPPQYQNTPPLVAASNGSDFLVVSGGSAVRVTSGGVRVDAIPIVIPMYFRATSAVWDGQRYVVAGNWLDYGKSQPSLAVFTIDASGTASALHVLRSPKDRDSVADPMLAWSGSVFLMTFRWLSPPQCSGDGGPCLISEGAHAMLLMPAFEAGTEFPISPNDAVLSTAVAWNGSEFLAIATDYYRLLGTRILPDGTSLGTANLYKSAALERLGQPSITPAGTDFIVAWRSDGSDSRLPENSYLMVVHPDGTASDPTVIDTGVTTSDVILLGAAGRQLLVSTHAVKEGPWYGASRVVIQTTSAETIGPAPKLTSVLDAGGIMLQWTPVSNATEYRLEYRSGNDPWREVEAPLGLTTSLSVHLSGNVKWEFRVRGWSGGGASPYSNAVSVA
ncbi:MAG: fibronectin type III domain-containing protein, partial [Acidobacteriota bacterium]|nr:fibronectin type III domain-containing protein [Acidobacteriota bacterium]